MKMASKTISVTNEVYELLSRIKLPHESFGDAIKRLCEEKTATSLYTWASKQNLWSDMSEEESKSFDETISNINKHYRIQEVEFD